MVIRGNGPRRRTQPLLVAEFRGCFRRNDGRSDGEEFVRDELNVKEERDCDLEVGRRFVQVVKAGKGRPRKAGREVELSTEYYQEW